MTDYYVAILPTYMPPPGEDFTSVTGFLMDDHFYGTVYMRDTVHYLEPHNRKSRDMHIFGDGLKTLLHKSVAFFC